SASSTNNFFYRVYAWMMAALFITAGVAYVVATSPTLYATLKSNMGVVILLFIAQIGLVVVLSALLPRLSFTTAVALFIAYAVSVGVTLSSLVLVYTGASLFATFLVAAGMFGC